jgi:hypothetical protein
MTPKAVATLLVLSAFATAGANSASADDRGFWSGGFRGEDGRSLHGGGFDGRGHRGTRPPVITGEFLGVDGYGGGYGGGYGKGFGDWYGISSGHNECPLFRKRVMTPDGWRVQMVPVC